MTEKCWVCGRTDKEVLDEYPKKLIDDGFLEADPQIFKLNLPDIFICYPCYLTIQNISYNMVKESPELFDSTLRDIVKELVSKLSEVIREVSV